MAGVERMLWRDNAGGKLPHPAEPRPTGRMGAQRGPRLIPPQSCPNDGVHLKRMVNRSHFWLSNNRSSFRCGTCVTRLMC